MTLSTIEEQERRNDNFGEEEEGGDEGGAPPRQHKEKVSISRSCDVKLCKDWDKEGGLMTFVFIVGGRMTGDVAWALADVAG